MTTATKLCKICGNEFPATREFFYTRDSKLYNSCKSCHKERALAWYHAHPEAKEKQRIAMRPRYQQDLEYRTKTLARSKIRAINSNPAERRGYYLRNLPCTFTLEQERQMHEYWGYKCAVCGRRIGLWHTIAVDHWIAVSDTRTDNPGHVATNILPLCHSIRGSNGLGGCNNNKGNSDPIEWLTRKLGKRKAKKKLVEIEAYFEWVRLNLE